MQVGASEQFVSDPGHKQKIAESFVTRRFYRATPSSNGSESEFVRGANNFSAGAAGGGGGAPGGLMAIGRASAPIVQSGGGGGTNATARDGRTFARASAGNVAANSSSHVLAAGDGDWAGTACAAPASVARSSVGSVGGDPGAGGQGGGGAGGARGGGRFQASLLSLVASKLSKRTAHQLQTQQQLAEQQGNGVEGIPPLQTTSISGAQRGLFSSSVGDDTSAPSTASSITGMWVIKGDKMGGAINNFFTLADTFAADCYTSNKV